MKTLEGKKTYIVCLVTLVYAVASVFLGKMDSTEAINYVLVALGAAGFRSAIAK